MARQRTRRLEFHEFALIFPAADPGETAGLREDIRKHGIKVPVVLFQGKILDGRSRYLIACQLGLPVPTEEWEGTAREALQLAASYNLYRRHLNQSQKAAVARDIFLALQDIDGIPADEAKEIATRATGASPHSFDRINRLAEKRPEVVEQIRNGETTIGAELGRSKTRCPACGHEW